MLAVPDDVDCFLDSGVAYKTALRPLPSMSVRIMLGMSDCYDDKDSHTPLLDLEAFLFYISVASCAALSADKVGRHTWFRCVCPDI